MHRCGGGRSRAIFMLFYIKRNMLTTLVFRLLKMTEALLRRGTNKDEVKGLRGAGEERVLFCVVVFILQHKCRIFRSQTFYFVGF